MQEDLLILNWNSSYNEHVLDGGILCFPALWKLTEKVNKPLSRIHKPVKTYDPKVTRSVQRMFNNLKTNYSNFELSGKVMDINYNMTHSSLDGSLVDDHVQREEFTFKIGKIFENWELNYSNKFDLSNNESELLEEEITLVEVLFRYSPVFSEKTTFIW